MIAPVGPRYLVRRIVDRRVGSFFMPDGAEDTPRPDGTLPKRGKVLAVGDPRVLPQEDGTRVEVRLQAAVGDVVHFNKWGGSVLEGDEGLLVIHEDEVLAVEVPDWATPERS